MARLRFYLYSLLSTIITLQILTAPHTRAPCSFVLIQHEEISTKFRVFNFLKLTRTVIVLWVSLFYYLAYSSRGSISLSFSDYYVIITIKSELVWLYAPLKSFLSFSQAIRGRYAKILRRICDTFSHKFCDRVLPSWLRHGAWLPCYYT